MTRTPILAAGGIALRHGEAPLIAVVLMRKRKDWVLPKGKLDRGETALAAAEREVIEETGHCVRSHEFLGTLAYETSGRTKIVHFWRMAADEQPSRPLMRDISAVDWLPLEDAIERLSRSHEKEFLAQVGPQALRLAGVAVPPPSVSVRQEPAPADTLWQRLRRWFAAA